MPAGDVVTDPSRVLLIRVNTKILVNCSYKISASEVIPIDTRPFAFVTVTESHV